MTIQVVDAENIVVPPSAEEWLMQLEGPLMIRFASPEPGRCRALVTLLHGNEPSGLIALHQLLLDGFAPKHPLIAIIASIETARTMPLFSHRVLPGAKDINRSFNPPYDHSNGMVALAILKTLEEWRPQALIDLHNTSGAGPAFGVTVSKSVGHLALVSHFSERCIFTELRMGALMEQAIGCPIVTVEAGGAREARSHHVAYDGIKRYADCDDLFQIKGKRLDVITHPKRFELKHSGMLTFADAPDPSFAITCRSDLPSLNESITPANTFLAWVTFTDFRHFNIDFGRHSDEFERYFKIEDGMLKTKIDLQCFMATTDIGIAEQDCLFYFTGVDDMECAHP